jgi:hypothetical protein
LCLGKKETEFSIILTNEYLQQVFTADATDVFVVKRNIGGQAWRLKLVILATWETEIGRILVRGQLGQKCS